jgi:hypothetical protein
MQWSARLNKIQSTPPAHSAGCSDLSSFAFWFPQAGVPQEENFYEQIFIHFEHVSEFPPRVVGAEFSEAGNLRDFSGQVVYLILPRLRCSFFPCLDIGSAENSLVAAQPRLEVQMRKIPPTCLAQQFLSLELSPNSITRPKTAPSHPTPEVQFVIKMKNCHSPV